MLHLIKKVSKNCFHIWITLEKAFTRNRVCRFEKVISTKVFQICTISLSVRPRFNIKSVSSTIKKTINRIGGWPWATPCLGPSRFFLNKKNMNIFRLMHIALFLSDRLNPNFVDKNSYFILFFLESYFFDEQSKLLDAQFYWNKKVKHRFIYERKLQ